MKEEYQSLQPLIEIHYNSLSDAEKRVAEYFLTLETEEDFAAKTVSNRISVSEATLSRFAKSLGFSGYREFIFQFRKSFTEKTSVAEENHKIVLNSYQELLNKMYAVADEEQLGRIAMQMKGSRRVYFAGKGSSGLAAEEIATRFRWLGVDAHFIRDSEAMRIETVFMNENDLVVGLSISGTKSEVLHLLRESKKRGGTTVLLTGNTQKSFYDFCREVILVPSIEYLNNGNLISPQFPLLMFGDMLYASFVELNHKKMKQVQDLVQRALREE